MWSHTRLLLLDLILGGKRAGKTKYGEMKGPICVRVLQDFRLIWALSLIRIPNKEPSRAIYGHGHKKNSNHGTVLVFGDRTAGLLNLIIMVWSGGVLTC